jgi:hypothetical protein
LEFQRTKGFLLLSEIHKYSPFYPYFPWLWWKQWKNIVAIYSLFCIKPILCAFKKGLFWAKRRKSGYIPLTITVKNNSDYYDNVSATGCSENGKSFYEIIQTFLFAKTSSTICASFIDNHLFKIDKSLSGDILAKDKRGAHSG